MKQTQDNINRAWDKLIKTAVTTETQKSFNVNLELDINGETWNAYSAYVSHRDILIFCKEGTATYFVDTYGDKNIIELFDWEKEEHYETHKQRL